MEDIRSIYFRRLQARLGGIVYELTRVRHAPLRPTEAWCPAINAYRCRDHIVICVELAGLDKSAINLSVEPQRVLIRGTRSSVAPNDAEHPGMQLLALEIDEGPFEREVILPVAIDPEEAKAEQHDGILWIHLPLPAGS